MVSRFGHKIDDGVHNAARHQGRPHFVQYTASSVAQRGRTATDQNGFQAAGTTVTVDNALKMLMVKSANDMAVTIAEGVGGSIEGFADLMNANARRLGMSQSNFVNPERIAGGKSHHVGARSCNSGARAYPRISGIRQLLAYLVDPLRQSRDAQLQLTRSIATRALTA